MFRRKRRRSSFARRSSPQTRLFIIGGAVVVVIGLFIYFIGQADRLAPEPSEIRVELPEAFED